MKKWFLILPLLLTLKPSEIAADSIWDRRDQRAAFLFHDNRARNIGDIVTIAILENTNANEREQRQMAKSTDGRVTTAFTGSSSSGTTNLNGALNFDLRNQSNRVFNGSAQLTADRRFTDRMALTVVDIMPNGNLVVEGYRSRVVSGEQRVLRITGIVRPADIDTRNVVPSGSVANFKVSYIGRGPESSFVQQGYWGRVMNLLWPF
jgi:flagellar L-ring protein FlgH